MPFEHTDDLLDLQKFKVGVDAHPTRKVRLAKVPLLYVIYLPLLRFQNMVFVGGAVLADTLAKNAS